MIWLRVNSRPICATFGVLGMLALVHFWPELKEEKETARLFIELLSAVMIAIVPGIRSTQRSTDE